MLSGAETNIALIFCGIAILKVRNLCMYPGITVNCSPKKNKTMIVLISLLFIVYVLLGIMICDKLGILYDNDDFLDSFVDGICIAFWPITVMIHFLLDD